MKYLESIAERTGFPKKYADLAKLVEMAIKAESDGVYIDFLTYGDLELMKTGK